MLFEINVSEIACVIETTKTTSELPLSVNDKVRRFVAIPEDEIRRTAEVILKSGVRVDLNAEQIEILESKLRDCGVL